MDETIVKIRYKCSKSANYMNALELSYFLGGNVENGIATIELTAKDVLYWWDSVHCLLNIVDKWKGFEFHYRGFLCDRSGYRNTYYGIQHVRNCYYNTLDSCCDFSVCNGSRWGCVNLDYIGRVKKWYEYGHYSNMDTWVIDKDRIIEVLSDEMHRKKLDACPAFDIDNLTKHVTELPDHIVIDENWEVLYEVKIENGKTVKVPSGIRIKYDLNRLYSCLQLDSLKLAEKFKDAISGECPYKEGSPEWADWHIDRHINKNK